MTKDDCKLITEKLLGEEWNEMAGKYYKMSNRTFTDPQDFFACFEKLVELGEWDGFFHFTYLRFEKSNPLKNNPPRFAQWCNSRTESGHYRLCMLCAEWLREKYIDRTHEECADCSNEKLNPPQCHGHIAGPSPCRLFKEATHEPK
jgi:hypothetical protein